ncbi:hypothetical protein [Dethiobacter alkaliphilus]|uniref:hypothetical protein n=1 Tax=Dethiobacter alkaliphilus TaxID=427926 RepID=UPI00222716A9|nr:hypothetical protein [Dethiobacter alkaliphilus]MCW3490257.1 hypothetical protein [Dethiobacter alkaliphilus]
MEVRDWIILALIILFSLIYWYRGRSRRIAGEKPAKTNAKVRVMLEEAGYEIVKAKPTVKVRMDIDDKQHPFELKSDYLVTKNGRKYLVRIRRDGKQARFQSKMWRSSLIRDVLAFQTAGILILNTEKETLHQIRFRI